MAQVDVSQRLVEISYMPDPGINVSQRLVEVAFVSGRLRVHGIGVGDLPSGGVFASNAMAGVLPSGGVFTKGAANG